MKVLVVIPTYDEIENIDDTLHRARAALPDGHVLVVDDGSPDGTADQVEKTRGASSATSRCCGARPRRAWARAYRAGFRRGLGEGFDALIEMDADLSHDPAVLPQLVAALEDGCRPRDRVALRARWLDPRLAVPPTVRSRGSGAGTPG